MTWESLKSCPHASYCNYWGRAFLRTSVSWASQLGFMFLSTMYLCSLAVKLLPTCASLCVLELVLIVWRQTIQITGRGSVQKCLNLIPHSEVEMKYWAISQKGVFWKYHSHSIYCIVLWDHCDSMCGAFFFNSPGRWEAHIRGGISEFQSVSPSVAAVYNNKHSSVSPLCPC